MDSLYLSHISKKLGTATVLDDVSLQMESGTTYGLIGKNGSGKTMLLRVIAGLVRPTEGEIHAVSNDQILTLHKDVSVFPNVGILIENAGLYPEFTGFQNLKFLADIRKRIGTDEIRKAISDVGLDPDDKRPIRKYSLGMRQRIVLAQAIMEKPELLLLDEPGNGLDQGGIDMLKTIVNRAKESGAIVVISSHDSEIIETLCDRIYRMQEGRLEEAR